MAKEEENRIGAKGLSNASRDSNVLRYQYGRIQYHARQALLAGPTDDERETLEMIVDGATELNADRPLEGGEQAESLITKGKKAKAAKAAAEGEGE